MMDIVNPTLEPVDDVIEAVLDSSSGVLEGELEGSSSTIEGTLSQLGIRGYSAYELAVKYLGFEGTVEEWLASLKADADISDILNADTTQNWSNKSDFIPKENTFVIYTDYATRTNEDGTVTNIPAIKIGDGVHTASELEFVMAQTARALLHTLTIGPHVFDGTEDVTVEVYNGETNSEVNLLSLSSENESSMTMVNVDMTKQMQMTVPKQQMKFQNVQFSMKLL